jgi:ribosome maturation factor RimP
MSHPVIPNVLELAAPVAESLGLTVVNAVFRTNQSPPVLRVDVRNINGDTGLEDCAQMSHALEAVLDAAEVLPEAYVLEISSPGVSRNLESDREFISFKGFPISVTTVSPHAGSSAWSGTLIGRDEKAIRINLKGRIVGIPRDLVARVYLEEGTAEP